MADSNGSFVNVAEVEQRRWGGIVFNLTKISDEEYETAYSEISKRNNQGLLK